MEQPPKNSYKILILPIDYNKSFLDFTVEEIRQYYNWFLRVKNLRCDQLCNFLIQDPSDCLNEKYLGIIEIFLTESISAVVKSKFQYNEEMNDIPNHLKGYAKPDDYLFDKKTISICYDIGIYLGELIIKQDNKIKWELELADISADYGQPILFKKGIKLKLNPFRVVKNIAAKQYEGSYSDGQINSIFNSWKKSYKVS